MTARSITSMRLAFAQTSNSTSAKSRHEQAIVRNMYAVRRVDAEPHTNIQVTVFALLPTLTAPLGTVTGLLLKHCTIAKAPASTHPQDPLVFRLSTTSEV